MSCSTVRFQRSLDLGDRTRTEPACRFEHTTLFGPPQRPACASGELGSSTVFDVSGHLKHPHTGESLPPPPPAPGCPSCLLVSALKVATRLCSAGDWKDSSSVRFLQDQRNRVWDGRGVTCATNTRSWAWRGGWPCSMHGPPHPRPVPCLQGTTCVGGVHRTCHDTRWHGRKFVLTVCSIVLCTGVRRIDLRYLGDGEALSLRCVR